MNAILKCSVVVLILLIISAAWAVTPQPAEIERDAERKTFTVRRHENDTTCKVKTRYSVGNSDVAAQKRDEAVIAFYFDRLMTKKEVIEKVAGLMADDPREDRTSAVSIDCSFFEK